MNTAACNAKAIAALLQLRSDNRAAAAPMTAFLCGALPASAPQVRRLISNPTIKKDFSGLLAGQSPDRRKLAQVGSQAGRGAAARLAGSAFWLCLAGCRCP